ncbi:MAG TPA: hypothetical protein VJT31_22865, partial [Rugosimonospora sp.]|nr:hypothetical protein [Rugosimonospora sp.]
MSKGGTSTITYSVTPPTGSTSAKVSITITSGALSNYVTLNNDGADCGGSSCSVLKTISQATPYNLVVTAANASTSAVTGTITIKAALFPSIGGTPNSDTQSLTINPVAAAPTSPSPTVSSVPSLSGVVKDSSTGMPIADAEVQLRDDAQHTWSTGSNAKGQYTFRSTTDKPIVPGTLVVGVIKDGYQPYTRNVTGAAGRSITGFALTMVTAAASTSPLPADSQQAGADPNAAAGNSGAAANTNNAANGGGGSSFSLILIILGALLVLLGVGAIVLILLRRKDDGGEPDGGGDSTDPGPRRGAAAPVPAAQGAYRGAPQDATMVARSVSPDAPTAMIQRTPPLDEYPDPYNAPLPPRSPQPAYGTGGYGQGYPQPAGYDNAPTHPDRQPYQEQGAGYGSGYPTSGGYGDNGYQENTYGGGYGSPPPPPAADPYAAPEQEYAGQGYGNQYAAGQQPRAAEPTGLYDHYDQTYDQPRAGNGYPANGGYPAYPPPGGQGYASNGAGQGGYGGGQGYDQVPRGYSPPAYEPEGGEYDRG